MTLEILKDLKGRIERHLLLAKITIIPNSESSSLKGAMFNVPVDVADVCYTLRWFGRCKT